MKLSALAHSIGAVFPAGARDADISGIVSPQHAGETEVTFLSHKKYRPAVEASRCGAVIVRTGDALEGKVCLEVDDPYVGYAKAAQAFEDVLPRWGGGIHPSVVVEKSATVGAGSSVGPLTVIGAGAVVGGGCRIGARCVIEPNVSIGEGCRIDSGAIIRYGCRIGNRVIIQSGAVVGSEGFGNAREDNRFIRIPCFGIVVIEDDADIGAGTAIDRGNFDSTVIGKGVKLDNLIHVAHNVEIGENAAIAAQTGISGSTRIGRRVLIGGQAGFVGHIEIGDDAFIGAKAGVSKDVKAGAKVTGYPARDLMTMRRIEASQAQLPEVLRELKQLRNEMEALKRGISAQAPRMTS
ncbi:MAG: UDP-3-O-(3-hydroxymyristoyl)glucosamine N-acyltransferase [Chitinispirillaceae bacterium]|nr:UDP-3-O-(3-hydroxymyristoyl)glucosamine N-acyltransferase [Chitinispirillaceae bacterium]